MVPIRTVVHYGCSGMHQNGAVVPMTTHRSWILLAVVICGGGGLWFVFGKQLAAPGRIADQVLAVWVDIRWLTTPLGREHDVSTV
jgi:hypothetical protein